MYRHITVAFVTFFAFALVSISAFAKDSEDDYRHEQAKVGEVVFFEGSADDGDGSGEIDIDGTLVGNTLYVTGKVENLSSPVVENNTSKNGVHLYVGDKDDSHSKVFPLELQVTSDESEGAIGGRIELNDEQVTQLRNGDFRVGVHTEKHPKGEVHGKVKPD